MERDPSDKPSFSSGQRWMIFFSVLLSILAMAAMVVMLNYLGARYFRRSNWSAENDNRLSLQTVSLLKTITNQVSITLYYDKKDSLYPMVDSLLEEYRLKNPCLRLEKVDYLADAAKAQKVKVANKLGSAEDKDLVIFECEGRRKIVQGATLGDVSIEIRGTNDFVRHLKAFEGEVKFDSALLSVTSKSVRKAYLLEGHGEHALENNAADGYQKFGQVLAENNVAAGSLRLGGTNAIPDDCTLLVIAGPRRVIPPDELAKIRDYLGEGRHLLVLFNYYTVKYGVTTGLEPLLQEWNVQVDNDALIDPQNKLSSDAILVRTFIRDHPLSNPMFNTSGLAMVNPRSIQAIQAGKAQAGAPEAKEIAYTGPDAVTSDNAKPPETGRGFPLITVVERGRPKGVHTERGTTAIVVAGDSAFLSNALIDAADNRDFAGFAVNWLVEQNYLLQGVGPRPLKEYTLNMTAGQLGQLRWIFMGAMPGSILLLGFAVWLRRRV